MTSHSIRAGWQRERGRWVMLSAIAAGMIGAGCAEKRHGQLHQFLHANEHEVSAIEYRVSVPDAVAISAPQIEEIDREVQVIQPDGKITLRLIGEVKVAGLTAKEIAAKLREQLQPYYVDPKVSVRVAAHQSKKLYVFGEVVSPGSKPFTGRDTLLDVLAKAGPTYLAWKDQIQVIRPNPDSHEPTKIYADIDDMVKNGDMRNNVLLEPGDIVYVPPTPLAWMGHRIREVLYPITPALEAYERPADFMNATDEYQGDDDDDGDGRFRTFLGR